MTITLTCLGFLIILLIMAIAVSGGLYEARSRVENIQRDRLILEDTEKYLLAEIGFKRYKSSCEDTLKRHQVLLDKEDESVHVVGTLQIIQYTIWLGIVIDLITIGVNLMRYVPNMVGLQ